MRRTIPVKIAILRSLDVEIGCARTSDLSFEDIVFATRANNGPSEIRHDLAAPSRTESAPEAGSLVYRRDAMKFSSILNERAR
jgi:hypothetical protein